jgi:hypothetical protein
MVQHRLLMDAMDLPDWSFQPSLGSESFRFIIFLLEAPADVAGVVEVVVAP